MRKSLPAFLTVFVFVGGPLDANPVERACTLSGQSAASPALCACIGSAAREALSYREQRQVARLFRDPDEAEALRMSSNGRDEAFWERYQRFGATAEAMCG